MRFGLFPLHRSLATQLLLTYVVALVIAIGTLLGFLWFTSQQDSGVATQAQLQKFAELVRNRIQLDPAGVPHANMPLRSEWNWLLRDFSSDVKYRILDASGQLIDGSDSEWTALTPLDTTRFKDSDGKTLLIKTESLTSGAREYYIQVAIAERFSTFVRTFTVYFRVSYTLVLAFSSVILVTVAVYFTLRRVLKPLRDTSAAAAQIDARHLSTRLSTRQLPSEFLPLITAFNLTLDRLEKGYLVQRAFLADAAHELKTPLALLRAQIDVDGTTDPQTLLADVDRMGRQVNQLLHLAEASETQNYSFEPVDLSEVMEDVTEYLHRLALRHQVYVEIRGVQGRHTLQADRGASFMLLKNLVENAIQHSPAGGVVLLKMTADRLTVCDEGPGISADEIPHLFKRFWRSRACHNEGAGLGLSICQEIAAAHNWRISVESIERGAQFTLVFAP